MKSLQPPYWSLRSNARLDSAGASALLETPRKGRGHSTEIAAILGSLGLIILFLYTLRPDGNAIAVTLMAVPLPTIAALTIIELANLLAGAQKWRISVRYFRPNLPVSTLLNTLEATAAGSLLGQVLPPQIATAGARAIMEAPTGGHRLAVWATFHEQSFDLFALCSVGVVSGIGLLLGLRFVTILALCGIAAMVSLALIQAAYRLAARIAKVTAGNIPERYVAAVVKAAGVLDEASLAPRHVPVILFALSLLRIALMGLRAVIAFTAIVPGISVYTLALGFPAVQFVTALPIASGGIGLLEWGWTGILLKAGASLQAAADAAVVFRLTTLIALLPIVLVLGARRALVDRRKSTLIAS